MRFILCIALVGLLGGQSAELTKSAGYLGDLKTNDLLQILPPPPAVGDARDDIDRSVFQSTRLLEDSPRWALAQSDNSLSASGLLAAFSCSVGVILTPETAPQLGALLVRTTSETNAIVSQLKDHYRRKRPFLVDEGPICLPRSGHLSGSFDYPSGHATAGWATGLILAELWPSQATGILGRAREYGESRAFCGVHNVSAIEAGKVTGGAVVAMLHGSASFRNDLEGARIEVAKSSRKRPVNAIACAAQAKTLQQSPYSDRFIRSVPSK